MKNKIFSLMAVVMFVGNSLNANSFVFRDCGQLSMDIYNAYIAQGFTSSYANGEANSAYDLCAALGDGGREDTELKVFISN